MAERQPSRAVSRKRAAKPVAPPAVSESKRAASVSPADQIKALEEEQARLRFELDTARERIAALETARKEVLDRIAWVIDSLHNLKLK